MFRDLKTIFKITLCLGSTFLLLKLCHSNLEIRSLKEWTLDNLLNGQNYWIEGSAYFLVSYGVFYWLVPKLMAVLFNHKIENIIKKQLKPNLEKTLQPAFRKIINIIWSFQRFIGYKMHEKPMEDADTFDKFYDDSVETISIFFHLFIVLPFLLNDYKIVSLLLIAYLVVNFLYLPTLYVLKDTIQSLAEEKAKNA